MHELKVSEVVNISYVRSSTIHGCLHSLPPTVSYPDPQCSPVLISSKLSSSRSHHTSIAEPERLELFFFLWVQIGTLSFVGVCSIPEFYPIQANSLLHLVKKCIDWKGCLEQKTNPKRWPQENFDCKTAASLPCLNTISKKPFPKLTK